MERNGQPIQDYDIRHGVDPGITLGRLLPNLVPQFEEREAMRYANYNPTEWVEVPYQEKAACVAQYRLSRWIKLHSDDAVNDKAERDARHEQFKSSLRR